MERWSSLQIGRHRVSIAYDRVFIGSTYIHVVTKFENGQVPEFQGRDSNEWLKELYNGDGFVIFFGGRTFQSLSRCIPCINDGERQAFRYGRFQSILGQYTS